MPFHSASTGVPRAARAWLTLGGMVLLLLAALALALCAGSVALPVSELLAAAGEVMRGKPASLAAGLLELRLGRALVAMATGASLALAGVMMQALLRNPLADPYILGLSGGAAVGALGAMLLATAWLVDAAAFAGAATVSLLLYGLARRDFKSGSAADGGASLLLLTGVIVSAGCSAVVTLFLSIAPDDRLRGMVFWLIGDLSGVAARPWPWLLLGAALLFAWRSARAVNVMAMHGDAAAALGVNVGWLRLALFACSALLTASAVSSAGSIGFIGLIVPHACRFALGPDHRLLLPAAALTGAGFLLLADTLARTVLAPQQLPVGVVTALIGVPVFLLQLHRLRR